MVAEPPVLELCNVHAGYTDVPVLRGVDLELQQGTVTAVIGANGAGKSTLLKTVFGLVRASRGAIRHRGEDITRASSREHLRLGIVLVPQGRCNFPLMTVHENLEMGAYTRHDGDVAADIEQLYDTFEMLRRKRRELAGNLSGGEQQLLEMAMALVLKPRLMLVDEPSLGLSPAMCHRV
ncbi:MAG: ATP-binding cassette domain-containing protein, partial [Nitriliruptorales bacterium]|nr:ATP-binding cassette domain-containing protein [Nitriliruptorales bacterium]